MDEQIFELKQQVTYLEQQLDELKEFTEELSHFDEIKQKLNELMFFTNIEDLSNKISVQANETNISSAYHSGLHLAGDYTIHNNILWKCLSTTTNAPRDGAEWVQTNITEMMMDLANRISKLEANKEV